MARPRTPDASITVRAVKPVVAGLAALGHDVASLLRACEIDPALLEQPDARITHAAMMGLWQTALARSGDADLGLHVGEAAPIDAFDLHAYALLASRDLRDGLRRGCRYQRLIHDTTLLSLHEGADEGVLEHSLPDGRSVPRHAAEFLASVWFRFGRLIAGDDWQARLLCFDHDAPPDRREHERIFACAIRFASGRTAVHIPNHALDAINRRADPTLVGVLDRFAGLLLERSPDALTLAGRLRTWLLDHLDGGEPTAAHAAEAMHVSLRSLHRKLQNEGTSFRDLITALRREQAYQLLGDPRVSIAEVGFLLGFAESSAFHRAFKRWTGVTPAAYRSLARDAADAGAPPLRRGD